MFTHSWMMLVGYAVMSIGAGWLFYVAYKESWVQGLLSILVPFYVFYYIVTRWEKSRDPVLVHLLGWVIFFIGL